MSYYSLWSNSPGCRVNVFVHADARAYPAMLERSQSPDADPKDWKLDESGRPGIWVALSWLETMGSGKWRRAIAAPITDAELRARYGKAEADAARGFSEFEAAR